MIRVSVKQIDPAAMLARIREQIPQPEDPFETAVRIAKGGAA